jgi:selenium-binding protein 1
MPDRTAPRWFRLPLLILPAAIAAACDGNPVDASQDGDPLPDDQSPFVQLFTEGERESLLYVWTRDASGSGSDFIAVVDANPESGSFGDIVGTAPAGSTDNEAHHFGYSEDASRIYAGGMFSNRIFVYDVAGDDRSLNLARSVDLASTGFSGPHTAYAVPGGVLVTMMGGVDGSSEGAIVELDTAGDVVRVMPAPVHEGRPVNLYDVTVLPESNRMLTTGLAHHAHLAHGPPAPEQIGNQVVVWNWQTREVTQIAGIDAGAAVLRPMRGAGETGGFVNALFGNSIWYWDEADDGTLAFERVIQLPEGSLPADMRISPDDRYLFVSLWAGGKVQQYDITDPRNPSLVGEVELPQPNMMRLSPDGQRLYVTNSLLSSLDGEVQFGAWLLHVSSTGLTKDPDFNPDFQGFAGGRAGPHDMLLR